MLSSARPVATTDVDQARVAVADVFCPHRLVPQDRAGVRLRLHARRLGSVGLVDLDYGSPVRIDPGVLRSFYLVQRPLAGTARIRQGAEEIESSPMLASVLSPDDPTVMHWGAGNPQSIVYVSRDAVERQLRRLLGRPVSRPVRFQLGMPSGGAAVQAWQRAVAYVEAEVARDSALLQDPRHQEVLESLLVGQLLSAQPHNYTAELAGGTAAASRTVRRAVTLIDDHHAERLTVGDVAEAVGVSVRSLQEGFRRDLGTSPTAYLRERRLAAVRCALLAADPGARSVTDVAMAHGFAHLGRFSGEYRRAFGEPPSRTLAR